MFDIGFLELVLISIVGLLVLGPERLPVAIRTVGLYVGKLRRSFNSVRAEIERELKNDEIRRGLQDQEVIKQLREAEQEIRKGLEGFDDDEPHKPQPVGPKIDALAASSGNKPDASTEGDTASGDTAAGDDDADRGDSAESAKP